ncbi:pyrophosphate--fructose 6-phosphate 1-phosphotransferase [Streptomyces purpurascens]
MAVICPGLNAVIRAVVRKGVQEYSFDFVGVRDGWLGLLKNDVVPLDISSVRGILPAAGPSSGPPARTRSSTRRGCDEVRDTLAARTMCTRLS